MATIDLEFSKNEDAYLLKLAKLDREKESIFLGGGKKKIEKQHAKGKLTARERVNYLIDDGEEFFEIGAFAAHGMYNEYGGCPAAGVITGIGKVQGRNCMIVANDATVKAGAWFPMTAKKNLRAQEIAIENRIPLIYLVDSAGVFLPMQDEIFPDKEHFGRMFRNNAVISAKGIPQISAIMGACVAGGAYLPIMSDESIIVEGTGSIFLAGPYLVKAAIGEEVDKETLGGAHTQSNISGVTDYIAKDDKECLDLIKELIGKSKEANTIGLNRIEALAPSSAKEDIIGRFPYENKPYDTMKLLSHIVDKDSLNEYKKGYGNSMICCYARIDGWSVGIVINNREITKSAKGEMRIGGVIYSDASDKAARFIMNCNQKKIPLVFFHDVTGFMVGSRAEHGGIIKDGAKLVNAVSNSTVPKISIVIGNSYGAGNYAMCGKAYDPRFIFAWPTAKIAVMGGMQAAKVLAQIKSSSLKAKGETLTKDQEAAMIEEIQERYDNQTSAYYAASRLWVDEIIDPRETREAISKCLTVANYAPIEEFNVGVIQT